MSSFVLNKTSARDSSWSDTAYTQLKELSTYAGNGKYVRPYYFCRVFAKSTEW